MTDETTLILIKPDAVVAGYTDKIFDLYRKNGFRLDGVVSIAAHRELVEDHFAFTPFNARQIGQSVLDKCARQQLNPEKYFLTNRSVSDIGYLVDEWTIDYMTSNKLYACVLKGESAISRVKQLSGSTYPAEAAPDTIRHLFGTDSFETCLRQNRAVQNMVHAADSQEEADYQIKIWFPRYQL